MTTFKAGWRIIAAHKLYMTFYVVWLCVMMVMMSFAVVSGSVRDDDKTVFTTARASVAVVNRVRWPNRCVGISQCRTRLLN